MDEHTFKKLNILIIKRENIEFTIGGTGKTVIIIQSGLD
jgi:hypothetical protein